MNGSMLTRRSLIGGILAAAVAPAFVRSGILMPVRSIYVPPLIGMHLSGTPPSAVLSLYSAAGVLLATIPMDSNGGRRSFEGQAAVLKAGRVERAVVDGLPSWSRPIEFPPIFDNPNLSVGNTVNMNFTLSEDWQ